VCPHSMRGTRERVRRAVLGWRPNRSGEACPDAPCPIGSWCRAVVGPNRRARHGRVHSGDSAHEMLAWRKKARLDRGTGLATNGQGGAVAPGQAAENHAAPPKGAHGCAVESAGDWGRKNRSLTGGPSWANRCVG
jgi:hypothetical protein